MVAQPGTAMAMIRWPEEMSPVARDDDRDGDGAVDSSHQLDGGGGDMEKWRRR